MPPLPPPPPSPRGTVFFGRHGERVDHVDPAWPATAAWPADPELTPRGLEQARELGERLRAEGVSVVFTSPFLRTVQTAHAVADVLDVPLVIEDGLGEWLNASWFGDKTPRWRPASALVADYPRLALRPPAPYTGSHAASFPESRAQLYTRAGRAARHIVAWAAAAGAGSVVCIGHGISCEAGVFGLDAATKMKLITYCSLSVLTPDAPPTPAATPTYTATTIADASFLTHPEGRAAARYAPPPLPGAADAPTPPASTGEGDYVVVAEADIRAATGDADAVAL